LAARSAQAAKETTDMIEGSIRKVEVGTKIATDTADRTHKDRRRCCKGSGISR
jgi:methyl-accepting chemotaxis protein